MLKPIPTSRRLWAIAAITVAFLVAGYGYYYRYWKIYYGLRERPFTTAQWIKADPEGRGEMVGDLMSSHKLEGMTLQELVALLGEPDTTTTVDEMYNRWSLDPVWAATLESYGPKGAGLLAGASYHLGSLGFNPRAPMVFSSELHVSFRRGRVERAYIDD